MVVTPRSCRCVSHGSFAALNVVSMMAMRPSGRLAWAGVRLVKPSEDNPSVNWRRVTRCMEIPLGSFYLVLLKRANGLRIKANIALVGHAVLQKRDVHFGYWHFASLHVPSAFGA